MKKYQLGDKWSNDFDYDGLIRSCNDADVSWGADKLEKLYDSLVDVNYHDLARDVDKAVEHLRREDEGDMAVAIESLDKVRETIKKDYFEHESGYVNTEVDDEGNEKVVLYDDKGESKGSFASEKQALKYAKEIGLSPDVMAQGGEISVNDWEDLAEESFFKEEVVVVNGQRYVVSEIKGTPYGNSIIFIGIDLNNRGQGKKVLFDYGSGINKIEDYAKGGEIGYKEKVIKELEELGYFEYNAKELYQKHRDLIDLSDKKSPKAMARSLANTEGHSYAKGGKIETQKAIDRLQLKLDALDEEIDQSPISDINLAMKEYKEIQSEIERHKKDLSKPYAEGGEIPKSVVEEFKSKLKDENFPYREDDLDLYYEENYTWKEEEDNRKKLIDQIDLGDLVEAENGQNYYVVYDYSDGFYWVTKRESERYNEDASGYTLDKDNIVRIIEKGSSYAKGGSTKAEYVVTLSNPADSTPSGKKSFTLKASSPEEARKIATEIIKKDFGYYLSIGYNDIRIKKKMAKGGEVEAEHYWKPINEETVEDSLYKYYYDYPKGTTFDGRIWVSFKGLSHSKDNLYERIDAIRNNVHWVSYTISDEPKSAYGTEGSWSSIYISIGNLTANEIREILLGSEGDSSLPTRVGEDLETEGIKAGELGFETYGKYVDLEVNTEGEEDEYAKGGALDKEFKFTKNFVIYVPSTSNVGDTISKSELEKRVKEVEKYVADEFGGYTETETEGGYKSTSGDIIEEDVVKVSVFAQNDDWQKNEGKVVAKVKEWANKWGQEAIGFEYEGDLYYIDDDGKFTLGGVLMAGIAGYVGYKIGRARPQKKGFETEKAVGRKFGKKFKRKKKMSKGGKTYAEGGELPYYLRVGSTLIGFDTESDLQDFKDAMEFSFEESLDSEGKEWEYDDKFIVEDYGLINDSKLSKNPTYVIRVDDLLFEESDFTKSEIKDSYYGNVFDKITSFKYAKRSSMARGGEIIVTNYYGSKTFNDREEYRFDTIEKAEKKLKELKKQNPNADSDDIFMSMDGFWNREYKHYFRGAGAKKQRKVYDQFTKEGLDPSAVSNRHLEIIEKIIGLNSNYAGGGGIRDIALRDRFESYSDDDLKEHNNEVNSKNWNRKSAVDTAINDTIKSIKIYRVTKETPSGDIVYTKDYTDYGKAVSDSEKYLKGKEVIQSFVKGYDEKNKFVQALDSSYFLSEYELEQSGSTYADGGEIEGYNMDEVVKHFVMAGLWASNDDEGEPLEDSYDADDVSKESYEKIAKGATKFINENKALLKKHNISTESLGHDLFLDSQGHGVGFWDRGYGDDGDTLSKSASKIFASDQPYVGDDKKIYFKKGGSIKSSFFSGELSFLNW